MQNLNQLVQNLYEELRGLAYVETSEINRDKIQNFNQLLSAYFPQAKTVNQFKGKIEDLIVQMHQTFDQRIQIEKEDLSILLNVYSCKATKLELNDIQQIQDCVLLHFPNASIQFQSLLTEAVNEDELIALLEFKSL